ncbi:MAG: hypothetical protein ACYC5O_02250 [Anaerolineae bacterium]
MRLVGFDQGKVTLELDAEECLSLARACQVMLSADADGALPEVVMGPFAERMRRLAMVRSLSRALLACSRVGRTQRHLGHGVTVARALSITEHRPQAIVAVD